MELEGFYTLTKEQELNDEPKKIHKGDSITGIVEDDSLAVGRSLVVSNAKIYRITSVIVEITKIKDDFVIETLNSFYTLKKFIPNEER